MQVKRFFLFWRKRQTTVVMNKPLKSDLQVLHSATAGNIALGKLKKRVHQLTKQMSRLQDRDTRSLSQKTVEKMIFWRVVAFLRRAQLTFGGERRLHHPVWK